MAQPRHRMLRLRQRLIFTDDLRVIAMRVQRTQPVDTGEDDVFRCLRFVLPA